ncbi:MAG: DUF721 domain-containing protein [Bacteroidetes bacterium]|nr:DUF721 domain-containing protein [Bacteroidota bacterium]
MKEAIRRLLERYRLQGRINEIHLVDSWPVVVGSLITKHTKSLKIRNGILFVELDSAALRNELTYARTKLMAKLNEEVGAEVIKDIVFR